MREMYCYDAFCEAMKRRDEGFVVYKDTTIEFFETIEQASEAYDNSPEALECGWVEEEVIMYFPELVETKEYSYESFCEALGKYEGFIIYNNDTMDFFDTIEQAAEVFKNTPDAIEYGSVELRKKLWDKAREMSEGY